MTNYIWTNFGVLNNVNKDERFVLVSNEEGRELKMSIASYEESADSVYQHALDLVGKQVKIKTSQVTGNWNKLVWFNAIESAEQRKAALSIS